MDRYSDGVKVHHGWHHVGVKIVTNASIGLVWVDKDISAYVGKASVLALIKVVELGVTMSYIAARRDGETADITVLGSGGVNHLRISTGKTNYFNIETKLGVFEWKARVTYDPPIDAWLEGYVD